MDDTVITPEQKRALFHRMHLKSLWKEWYGPVCAARESAAVGAQIRPAAAWVEEITRDIFSDAAAQKISLENRWEQIVGEPFCRMCRPGNIEDDVLTLEIRHSAYRKELENAFPLLLTLINRAEGGPYCRELRLSAANRRSRKFEQKP